MEVRRAMFLRAWNHNLEKIAYPLGFRAALGGFLVGCVELGMSGFSKWRVVKVTGTHRRIGEKQGYLQKVK